MDRVGGRAAAAGAGRRVETRTARTVPAQPPRPPPRRSARHFEDEIAARGITRKEDFGQVVAFDQFVKDRPEVSRKRSEEHTSELQSRLHLVCRLLLEKKKKTPHQHRSDSHNSIATCTPPCISDRRP